MYALRFICFLFRTLILQKVINYLDKELGSWKFHSLIILQSNVQIFTTLASGQVFIGLESALKR